MRNINLRYVDETYDEKGLLQTYKLKCPDNFNFGYDIVDDIAGTASPGSSTRSRSPTSAG